MKCFFAGLAATAALLFVAGPSSAAIVITEVHPTGSSNSTTYEADWFELTNTGASAVDITGWRVDDDSNNFANALLLNGVTSINPGQSVVFIESSSDAIYDAFKTGWFGTDVPSDFTIGRYNGSGIGLGAGGDQLNIFDSSGTPITSVVFGAATAGTTFDNADGLSGAISTLSAVGINGAFTSAAGGEIGSPGFTANAVPEPSTWALMLCGMGGLGLLARRRSQR